MNSSPRLLRLTRAAALAAVIFPLRAQPAAPASTAKADEPVRLSVFEVPADKDYGYQSFSTVTGTRANELLRDLPLSVTILNRQFLDDLAAIDPAEIFNYGLNIESANTTGIGNDYNGGGNAVLVRGVQSSWNSRDGFIWYAISDNFNTENIEILRGPAGNMYGDGRAGGVMNLATKRAKTRDFASAALRWDSEGSRRATLDYNRRLNARAGLRLNLMGSDQRTWKDTVYDRRAGLALAFTYDFTRRTRFSTSIERNWVRRTNARSLMTDSYSFGYAPGSGSLGAAAPAGTAVIQTAGTTQRWTQIGGQLVNLESTPTAIFRQTAGLPATIVGNVPLSIIPRHQQWNGPGDQLNHDSTAINAAFEHQLGERTTLEFAFNLQLSDRNDIFSNVTAVLRDVNPQLPDARGNLVANPNYEQLYVEHRYTSSQYWNSVPSYRVTALHDFDFGFTKQRVIASVSLRDEKFRLTQRAEFLNNAAIAAAGLTGTEARPTNNPVRRRFYLRDGNDGAIDYHPRADSDFTAETTGGQKQYQPFYSSSALVIGRYWGDRITTTAGVRRDNFNVFSTRVVADPNTGYGLLERDATGQLLETRTLNLWTTKWNYGGVFSPMKEFRVFWNYAENFQQNGTGSYFNGDPRAPRGGEGVDYGVSLYLLKDRVALTATRFDNKGINETLTAIPNLNVANEINALLGTNYNTGTPNDTRSRRTYGYEFELVTNLTRQWALTFKWSTRQLKNSDFAPRLAAVLALMKAKTTNTSLYSLTQQQYDSLVVESYNTGMQWNVTTRYSVIEGLLKGARIGVYGYPKPDRYYAVANRPQLKYDGYFMANMFAGYGYKFWGGRRADVQLNVENVLNHQTRIGSSYTFNSYLAPTKFILTHKIDF